jgi:hypothetical protein
LRIGRKSEKGQCDHKIGEKNHPIFGKSSQNSCPAPGEKVPTSKLNLKVRNVYIELLLETLNSRNELHFETAYLGENVKKLQ